MQVFDEKLCLQWNDFHDSVTSSFRNLRDDQDFTDVTFACEDGQQIEAHKVVLIASSPFFLNLLKRNKHPHALVYMRGVKFDDLVSMIEFLYRGEANVHQENLDSFLALSEELRLKGLRRQEDAKPTQERKSMKEPNRVYSKPSQIHLDSKHQSSDHQTTQEPNNDDNLSTPTGSAIALNSSVNLEELDTKVKSMMTFGEYSVDKQHGRVRICKECGKEGQRINIMDHIEANHISNICIPCNVCGSILKTRKSLRHHVRRYHS